jgi:hypothetical protein
MISLEEVVGDSSPVEEVDDDGLSVKLFSLKVISERNRK